MNAVLTLKRKHRMLVQKWGEQDSINYIFIAKANTCSNTELHVIKFVVC